MARLWNGRESKGKPEERAGSGTGGVSATATAGRYYSHARSSGLDLAKKFSSTLALIDTEFGCTVVGLAAAG